MTNTLKTPALAPHRFTRGAAVIHLRFAGRSTDVELSELDIGPGTGDGQVKRAVAERVGITVGELNDYVIDRHANGNLTLRPEAVFG